MSHTPHFHVPHLLIKSKTDQSEGKFGLVQKVKWYLDQIPSIFKTGWGTFKQSLHPYTEGGKKLYGTKPPGLGNDLGTCIRERSVFKS